LKVAFGVSIVFLVLEVGHNVSLIDVKVGKKESNVGEKRSEFKVEVYWKRQLG
jgi:hypothetical protein